MAQRNKAWANQILGNNTSPMFSIGSHGCLITCLAMMTGSTPDKINRALKPNGFNPGDGRLASWNIRRWLSGAPRWIKTTDPYKGVPFPQANIAELVAHIKNGQPAVIEVDMQPGQPGHQQHFVLAVGAFGTDKTNWQIVINDPWYGDQVLLTPRYRTTLAAAITKAALYTLE